ncbi:prepilin-type N-terminal cleavage/methylation domain-containing protein [Rubrobacter tropicus]|uniref:Prepilin-type N-terminal cleavage/methylation domain-containing protein n=1 Tax=Rubrobacter tropicus TaxID=2653851 RepID=A0A6G8Q901_9ACTN|nr:prepilin-type N-terminal cleavage/methylation domain-containing protein [Rubrobacter tropicus]QIN82964.1 prepilin-type N-terminal cleavage/methylation domain-containing protein [Rubrobacter tropicus]
MTRFLKGESGYSLVEVMVAIMILAVAIIPMVSMFDAGLNAAVAGSNYDQARALANEKLEETKALTLPAALARYPVGSSTDCNPAPPAGSPFASPSGGCEVTTQYMRLGPSAVEPAGYQTNLIQVSVTVDWASGGNYEVTGLVAK